YAAGSRVVSEAKPVTPVVEKIASELGLRADGLKGKAPATARPIGRSRVALYKPWVENIDEGWTRWLLERYEFPFKTITDADVRAGNLRAQFDAIVVPAAAPARLVSGHAAGAVPAEYAGGLGQDGVDALKAFVEAGGTLICLDQSGGLAIAAFKLPLRDVAREATTDKFCCPGSILRLDVDPSRPLAYGMIAHTAAFFSFSSAYDVLRPDPGGHSGDPPAGGVETIGRYGTKDL